MCACSRPLAKESWLCVSWLGVFSIVVCAARCTGSDIHTRCGQSHYHLNQVNDCSHDVPRRISLSLSHLEEFKLFLSPLAKICIRAREKKNAATTTPWWLHGNNGGGVHPSCEACRERSRISLFFRPFTPRKKKTIFVPELDFGESNHYEKGGLQTSSRPWNRRECGVLDDAGNRPFPQELEDGVSGFLGLWHEGPEPWPVRMLRIEYTHIHVSSGGMASLESRRKLIKSSEKQNILKS